MRSFNFVLGPCNKRWDKLSQAMDPRVNGLKGQASGRIFPALRISTNRHRLRREDARSGGHAAARNPNLASSWNIYRRSVWARALRDLRSHPDLILPVSLAERLIAGWGEPGRRLTAAFLQDCFAAAKRATGTILDCDCGLETIVLAIGAKGRPASIVSLAAERERRTRMLRAIRQLGLQNVSIRRAALKSYGDFEWYDVDDHSLRRPIAAVVCFDSVRAPLQREQVQKILGDALAANCPVLTDGQTRIES